jgi:hypothetical protein
VTVTRSQDSATNPGGYNFNIYLENTKDSLTLNPSLLVLDNTGCGASFKALFKLTRGANGAVHTPFTQYSLPLALPETSATLGMVSGAATFKGATVTRMPLYKVDGNYWAVTFNTNIGDIPPLVATPTKYLTEGTTVSVYDNVVRGNEPKNSVLNTLLTGVQYSARMQSYTRGHFGGYSNYSQDPYATAVPSGPPPTLQGFQAVEVREVTEVQEVAVYASRLMEIQTITTSAEAYTGSQEFILSASLGHSIVGNFALRFAEVQTLVMTADFANVVQGSFQLLYSYFDYSVSVMAIVERTACLDVSSTAEQVQTALHGLAHIDTVEVVRSGYGGYTDFFGFSWSVTFTGNLVAGNVQPLVVLYGNEGSTCTNSQPVGLHFAASTNNDNRAVGTDTEVQQITTQSIDHVVEGAYKLSFASTGFGTKSTACLSWDATAMDMQLALMNGIQSIDEVLVERSGSGTSVSNFGYVYNIFFTGNAMHARGTSGSALPLLTYSQGSCTPLAHVVDGVVTALTSLEASVNTTRLREQGYYLAATTTTTDQLLAQLAIMPLFVNIDSVRRSLSDDNTGYQFTVNFGLSMGKAPVMVCGMDLALTAVPATCSHFTILEGNTIAYICIYMLYIFYI